MHLVSTPVIEQTFWTTSVRLHPEQSNSASTMATITAAAESKNSKSLCFTYANRARQQHNGPVTPTTESLTLR